MKRVLVIGGYGNFGSFISRSLAREKNIKVVIAGRSLAKAISFAKDIGAEAMALDINSGLASSLQAIKPDIIIHTSGPFQSQGYQVAEACIECGAHYIDLADSREFVSGISCLSHGAERAGIAVISGASSVPCFTSALIDHYIGEFQTLEHVDYGITTAQKTTRGVATTAAILSYTGKPFKTLKNGEVVDVYGWQGLRAKRYRRLGWRLLGNCNVPDLELFPKRYPALKTIKFYAGLELPFIHMTLWGLSWLVRIGLIKNFSSAAPLLLKLSFLFDWLGSENSGFHMNLVGVDENRQKKTIQFELIAKNGDGPFIPCTPAILLTKKLASSKSSASGAFPCIGFISKEEYLHALEGLDITWSEKNLSVYEE